MVFLSLKMFCLNQQLMQLCLYLNKFERKISEQGAVRAGKAFTLLSQMKIWMILLKS